MDVGSGERVIEEAGGREPRLDAACARQAEVLEPRNVAVDGEIARQLRCEIGHYNIETVVLQQALPSHACKPSAGSFHLINLRHFISPAFLPRRPSPAHLQWQNHVLKTAFNRSFSMASVNFASVALGGTVVCGSICEVAARSGHVRLVADSGSAHE